MKEAPNSPWGDDPLAYYDEHYPGVSRGRLKKINQSLYSSLYYRRLLLHVPLATHREKRVTGPWDSDPLAYYEQHFAGCTDKRLIIEHWPLYMALQNAGLLHKIPKKKFDSVDASKDMRRFILGKDT